MTRKEQIQNTINRIERHGIIDTYLMAGAMFVGAMVIVYILTF